MSKGLDNWITSVSIEDRGIDPRIVLEARNRQLFMQVGNFNLTQARELAKKIIAACDEAEGEFR